MALDKLPPFLTGLPSEGVGDRVAKRVKHAVGLLFWHRDNAAQATNNQALAALGAHASLPPVVHAFIEEERSQSRDRF